MAFTQGDPLPDIRTTETKVDTAPSYYTDYLSDLAGAGSTAIDKTAATGIAAYDPLQTTGYGKIQDAAKAYVPGLTSASTTAATAAGGLDASRIGELMDPYQRKVVDEMARLQQENIQRSIMPTLRGAFVGRGDLGSQRYAAATGQTLGDLQRNLLGQQAGVLSSGYQNAVKAALEELDLQNRAAQTQAQIAKAEQELGLTGAGAMTKAGAERQAYEQAKLDYPLKQATSAAALMRGYQIPTTQTSTFVGPKAGLYQTSPLANILGVLSTLGAVRGGSTGDSALRGIYDFLRGRVGGTGGVTGTGTPPSMEAGDAFDYFFGPAYSADQFENVAYKVGGLASISKTKE